MTSKLQQLKDKFESSTKSVKDIMESHLKNPYGINAGSVSYANEAKTYFDVLCESKSSMNKSISTLIEKGVPKKNINIQKMQSSAYTYRYRYTVEI